MAQPVDVPRWATSGAVITNPSSGQKDTGWVVNQAPPAGFFNWYMNNVYLWVLYLQNLTTEVLTWTGLQTFNAGTVFNKPASALAISANGLAGTTYRAGVVSVYGSDYSGVGTGTQHDAAFTVQGGVSGPATGQRAFRAFGGDSSTGNGGPAVIGEGGVGVFAGDGGQFTGGFSSSASLQGGTGAYAKGGQNTTSGKGGYGAILEGRDGAKESGLGGLSMGGDVIGTAGTTVLRAAHHFQMGESFTDAGKLTRSTPSLLEATVVVESGYVANGGVAASAGGIRVINPTGFNPASQLYAKDNGFTEHHGLDMDVGQYMRMRPDTLANMPVHNYQGAGGSFNHMSMACTAALIRITGVSGTSATFSVLGDSINLATSPLTLLTQNTIQLSFNKAFVSTNYIAVCTAQGAGANWPIPHISNRLVGSCEINFELNTGVVADLRTNAQVIELNIIIFGRQVP